MASKDHAPRRASIKGQKLPRKLYPTITAAQRKAGLAPKMGEFISKNRASLEEQGNALGRLPKDKKMPRKSSTGDLRVKWGKAERAGRSALGKLMEAGRSRSAAKAELGDVHKVKFSADPKRK